MVLAVAPLLSWASPEFEYFQSTVRRYCRDHRSQSGLPAERISRPNPCCCTQINTFPKVPVRNRKPNNAGWVESGCFHFLNVLVFVRVRLVGARKLCVCRNFRSTQERIQFLRASKPLSSRFPMFVGNIPSHPFFFQLSLNYYYFRLSYTV